MGLKEAEHPHRCREGHRWQHTGSTAATCEIPVHDAESGDLTFVGAPDCPLCSGREDLLIRDLHSHYCNTCAGDWDHEGRCLEGLAASCPWCFPVRDAAPAPGARRGPHFHFCPECAQDWQHDASCAAPLRAALPECSGCRGLSADPATGERAAKPRATFSPSRPRVSPPTDVLRTVHGLVRSAVVLASVAVALTIPILFQVSSTLLSLAPRGLSPVTKQRADLASTSSNGGLGAVALPPESAAGVGPSEPPGARRLEPETLPSTAGAQLLHRNGERRGDPESSSARKAQPREVDVQPDHAVPAALASTAGVEQALTPSSPPKSSPPRDRVAEAPSLAQDAVVAPHERTSTSGATAQSSNPDSRPRGGATLDALLQGPSQFDRVPQPRNDLTTRSEESPRWDRATLSVLTHAVVDIRPVTPVSAGLERPPAGSRRAALELPPQPIRGFIIDEFGHVVTSSRRLGEATSLEATLYNGRRLGATVVVRNWLNDIAVLQLERRALPLIALGDSGALVVGDRVLTIGSESGPDRTLTVATVLATGAGTGGNLAVDLTPTPERVGGPLLNHSGQAVGIVIDDALPTGGQRKLTFAVPVDRVKSLLRNLSLRPMAEMMNVPEAR